MWCQLLQLGELKQKQSWLAALLQRRIKLIWTVKRQITYCWNVVMRRAQHNQKNAGECSSVGVLNAGDLVRVRSREAIESTLDAWGQYKRCAFVSEMWQYCDQTFRVLKKVECFYDEVKQKICTCQGVVFLRGVTCSGKRKVFSYPCDRNCFLFWHSVWLEKVEGGAEKPQEAVAAQR